MCSIARSVTRGNLLVGGGDDRRLVGRRLPAASPSDDRLSADDYYCALGDLEGLDYGDISGREFARGEVLPGGLRLARGQKGSFPIGGGLRSEIRGFSKKSRRRLTDRLMEVEWFGRVAPDRHSVRGRALFVTLTYPADFPDDWEQVKAHLAAFYRRLARSEWGFNEGLVWKLEYQRRGAPHFHLVMFFPREVAAPVFHKWVLSSWYEVVGSCDRLHRVHGAHVTVCHGSAKGVMSYLAKYMGKSWESDKGTGRVWGVWGSLPLGQVVEFEFLNRASWCEFMRRVRKWGRSSKYLSGVNGSALGLRLFGSGANLAALLRGLAVCFKLETEY